MYDVKETAFTLDNFFAGSFPVAKDFGEIKANAKIRKHAPIVQGENGIEELTAAMLPVEGDNPTPDMIDKLIGIAADEPSGDEVVYYLTGEFFVEALTLPTGVTPELLKPAFRKLGIFLKEMKDNG